MKNWEIKKLGEILQKTETVNPNNDPEMEFEYIDVSSVSNITFAIEDTSTLKGKDAPSRARKLVKTGDVLFATVRPTLRRISLVPQNLNGHVCSTGYCVLRPKANISNKFVFYYLFTNNFMGAMEKSQRGASYPAVTDKDVKEQPFPIPPLPEQQRIVAILDEAFAAIAKAKENIEKNLQNVREFFENYQQSIFIKRDDGWTEKPLGELATFRNGINFTKTSRGDSAKIVGVKDFQKNFWAPLDNLDVVTMEGTLPESDKLKENDILFVRSNGNMELIGRCLLVGKVTDKITYSGFTIRARLHGGNVMPKYLCHFLKSNSARRKMIDSGIGTNIKSLNQPTLSALIIPFPSYSEQSRLVDQFEAIEAETKHLESIYQQKLADLEELKKSILQKAFSGELTASSEPAANDELTVPCFIQQEIVWA